MAPKFGKMYMSSKSLVKDLYVRIFANEHPELLDLFQTQGEIKSFSRGRSLFREGEEAEGFYWILDGNCKICKCFREEGEQIITLVGPGDFVGLTSCLNATPYKKGCVSLQESTTALFVERDHFYTYLAKHPTITLPLLRQIELKIDRIESRAAHFIRKTIDQRLAHAILILRDKFGLSSDNFLRLKLSPQEFANFIGTTRTTIYRIFKSLENDHIIEIKNKRIRLLDQPALTDIAHISAS